MPPASTPARRTPPAASRDADDQLTLDIQGRSVKCTRLGKVLYPAAKFTKAEVIEYYIRVAPYILPHLKNRPVTLKRYPDGVTGEAYWEKDVPSFAPEWIETFPVPRRAGGPDIRYILIQNTATLAWAANAAALELHPFLHRAPAIESPTSIVFDLDPGEGADLRKCIEVAFEIKAVLDHLGLKVSPKVSGSKGLQLYVPLNRPSSYDLTQPLRARSRNGSKASTQSSPFRKCRKRNASARSSSTGAKIPITRPQSAFIPCGRQPELDRSFSTASLVCATG